MNIELIISFVAGSVLLTLPDPDNIFELMKSITKGKRDGIAI